MSKTIGDIEKELAEMSRDMREDFGGDVSDEIAFELARNIIDDDKELEAIVKSIGVTDVTGWVADRL